jgi:hypothetical protein
MAGKRLRQLFARVKSVINSPRVQVLHGAVSPLATFDFGSEGNSSGDVRVFSFSGTSATGSPVTMDWVMTTTGPSQQFAGAERRITTANFSFGVNENDQLALEGVGLYPSGDSTFESGRSLVRMISGGLGRYSGATGQVLTKHFEDNTWSHTFYLDAPLLPGVPDGLNYRIGGSATDRFHLKRQEKQQLDVVVNFDASAGDRLKVKQPKGEAQGFRSVPGRQNVLKAIASDALVVYNESTGGLYLNANGSENGLGRNGGLLAVMGDQPQLTEAAFAWS